MLVANTIEVKRLGDNVLDVFTDKGWENWSRFEVAFQRGRLTLKLIKGKPMTQEAFKTLITELNK